MLRLLSHTQPFSPMVPRYQEPDNVPPSKRLQGFAPGKLIRGPRGKRSTDIEERSGHSPARPAALKATTELELPSHMDGRSFQTAS